MPDVPGSAENSQPQPDPDEQLVKVFDSDQESEALVVKGLLQSAGIDADITSLDAPQDILPGVGGVIILVREEQADEAKRLIEASRQSPDSLDDTAEIEFKAEPPPA